MTLSRKPRVGVLAMQGDVGPHVRMLREHLDIEAAVVRDAGELAAVDGLIIPGGESTTIGKLLERHGLMEPIRERAAQGMPIYGTCAGMILLAKEIDASDQLRLGLMDITVARNAFGRQVDSFEADIPVPSLGKEPVRGVFIRAPYVASVRPGVEVLARYEDRIVAVQQGALLASAFHPELTADARMHRHFVELVRKAKG